MEIVSTMGSGSLGRELDLDTLIVEIEDYLGESVDANFMRNGMATVRLEKNGPAYTIYRTGTFQIRGAENEEILRESEGQFQDLLSEIGVEISDYKFNHVTSVFLEKLDREVNLETLTIDLGMEKTEYEPEQFPGLIYRPSGFEVTLLVFASGKIIIGGTTSPEEASSAVRQLKEEIDTLESV